MKITRLKKGYRIDLSDVEFDLVSGLVSDGIQTYQGDEDAYAGYIEPKQKAAWTRREKKAGTLMSIDEDQRDSANDWYSSVQLEEMQGR